MTADILSWLMVVIGAAAIAPTVAMAYVRVFHKRSGLPAHGVISIDEARRHVDMYLRSSSVPSSDLQSSRGSRLVHFAYGDVKVVCSTLGPERRLVDLDEVYAIEAISYAAPEVFGRERYAIVSPASAGLERENLVILGSPVSNPLARKFHMAEQASLPGAPKICTDTSGVEWVVRLNGQRYVSTYEYDIQRYVIDPIAKDLEISDVALVTFGPSPWAEGKEVLTVAGLGGLGTRGAAMWLHDSAVLPQGQRGGSFAAVIRVTLTSVAGGEGKPVAELLDIQWGA